MAIDTQGLNIETDIRALEEGDGFVVNVSTDWFPDVRNHKLTQEQRNAINQAQSDGLLGLQLEGHEPSFADANTRINSVVDQWVTDISTFITNFNTSE
jgi:hypothetical protein